MKMETITQAINGSESDEPSEATSTQNKLTHHEKMDVNRRIAPRAAVVYETIRREGEEELYRSMPALAWSGLAAGLSMGFSFITEALLHINLPDAPWRTLISKFGYCIGFLIVVLGRQQLFTENTITPILQLLSRHNFKTVLQVLRLWSIVLLTNLIGGAIFAFVVAQTNLFGPEVHHILTEIGQKAMAGDFWTTLTRGIFAGWLIALMVWLLPFAESARVSVIIIITYIIGLGGFAHIIAGFIETFYVVVIGQATLWQFMQQFFIPTLLGNVFGGVAMVSFINYAQVASDNSRDM